MFFNKFNKNKKYIDTINTKGIFSNTYDEKYPQTIVNQLVLNHFKKAEKTPKCIFIGWDGCRGDAMKYLIKSESEKISGSNENSNYSAVNLLKKTGGVYITYVGGDNGFQQETSTAQGWASALCGKWMKKQWKTGIEWSLDGDYETVMQTLAKQGFKTSFSCIWPVHYDKTYKNEIEYAQNNNLAEAYFKFETDPELHENMLNRINSDDDFIFGIYENPDLNGHGTGFGDKNYRYVSGICNLDSLSYDLIKAIENRESFDKEDWLVVIGSDHGGHLTMHGTQLIEDRTTFLAVSKPIKEII